MDDQQTAILRLLIALGLGFVLGFERELRGQDAGLRTHILVSLGSCLFTLSSLFTVHALGPHSPVETRADITRIASQVVVGIGFLGGGAILRHGSTVKGLTTAANLWLTASVGLAAGLGLLGPAVFTTVLALVTLAGLRPVERIISRLRKKYGLVKDADLSHQAAPRNEEEGPIIRPPSS